MTTETRETLKNVQIKLPLRTTKDGYYSFNADEFIDMFELAIIKSPELKKELKVLINEILQ